MSYEAETVQGKESFRAHVYAAEQLFRCAERAPLFLREFTFAELLVVQAWLLSVAQDEADAAHVALAREEMD
jgi:hypothetical protein